MARKAFFSFHYKPDAWRAAQVRNMGMIEGNTPVSDNDWGNRHERWRRSYPRSGLPTRLHGRSCTVVLVGSNTAGRKWIKHEIVESWDDGMGVIGIHVHGLKDLGGKIATKGSNPFTSIPYGNSGKKLSSIVKCYNPAGSNSKERYDWIKKNLEAAR